MKHYAVLTIFIVLWLLPTAAFLQNWTQVQPFGGNGTETCGGLTVGKDGSVFFGGTFQNQLLIGSQTLTARGEADIFLSKFNTNGEITWAKRAGSNLEDEVTNLTSDAAGNLIVIGTFWQQSDFDTIQLKAKQNPKAIFLVKYNADGKAIWGKSLSGGALKNATDVVCDAAGNIFLTGFFSDSLQIEDTILIAKGTTDFFTAKFNSVGQLQWVLRQGQTGDTRATAMSITRAGDLIVAGFFNDTTNIADTTLIANTADQDLFITKISKNGNPIWAKKAGGVFDSDVTSIVIDEFDNIYLTGYFVGTLRLNQQLAIQSSTGQSDFFLLKYNSDGTPLQARALGGPLLQQATDMIIRDNLLIMSGFYQGNMTFDGFSFSTNANTVSGFVAAFNPNFICQWAKNIQSDKAIFANRIAASSNGAVFTGGSFTGKATFDTKTLNISTSYDVFLSKIEFNITNVIQIPKKAVLFQVFPNPTNGQVFIKTDIEKFAIRVTNSSGKQIFSGENRNTLDFSNLPKGAYFITFQTDFTQQTQQFIW